MLTMHSLIVTRWAEEEFKLCSCCRQLPDSTVSYGITPKKLIKMSGEAEVLEH